MTADLHDLLEDAVSDVEPRHGLPEIRRRTSRSRDRRTRALGVVAVGLAAAVVTVGVVLVSYDTPDRSTPDPAGPGEQDEVGAVYFIDREDTGSAGAAAGDYALRREFRPLPEIDGVPGPLAALMLAPVDRDYSTPWTDGAFEAARVTDDAIEVEIGPAYRRVLVYGERPTSADVQMVVWTMQAAFDRADLPVQFTDDGEPTGRPVARAPEGDVLADINISDPAEGASVSDTLVARGRARSPEGNVLWEIRDSRGAVVLDDFATAAGSYDRLYAWETTIDVSALDPGTYTFVASTEDPSGGTEGTGASSDTRTIVIE